MKNEDGGIAQLGEHLPCKQGVIGSIPIISTTFILFEVGLKRFAKVKCFNLVLKKTGASAPWKLNSESKQEIASKQQRGNKVQTFVDFNIKY